MKPYVFPVTSITESAPRRTSVSMILFHELAGVAVLFSVPPFRMNVWPMKSNLPARSIEAPASTVTTHPSAPRRRLGPLAVDCTSPSRITRPPVYNWLSNVVAYVPAPSLTILMLPCTSSMELTTESARLRWRSATVSDEFVTASGTSIAWSVRLCPLRSSCLPKRARPISLQVSSLSRTSAGSPGLSARLNGSVPRLGWNVPFCVSKRPQHWRTSVDSRSITGTNSRTSAPDALYTRKW